MSERGASGPNRLHHAAWITDDSEKTRHFYEDVLGMPLVATWCEDGFEAGHPFVHTFYAMKDGGALAFFEYAHEDDRAKELDMLPGHLALECDAGTQANLKDRLEAAGYEPMVGDHGYCVSMYVKDPNNLMLEFTVDAAHVEQINADQLEHAHADLERWLAGDHRPNNDVRPH